MKNQAGFKQSLAIYRRLLSYASRYWYIFIIAMIANIAYAGVDAWMAKLIKPLIDDGFVMRDTHILHMIPIFIPLLFLVRGFLNFTASYAMRWVGRQVVYTFRQEIFEHLQKLPASFYDGNSSGQLLSKMIFNVQQVTKATTSAITHIVRQSFLVIFLICVLFSINVYYTSVFMIAMPLILGLFVYSSKRFRSLGHRVQHAIGNVTHVAEENIEGYKVVRTFGGEAYEVDQFKQVNAKHRSVGLKNSFMDALSTPLIQFVGGCALGFTIYIATKDGPAALTAGAFSSFIVALIGLLRPIKQLTSVNSAIQQGIAGAHSVFDLLDTPGEVNHGTYTCSRVRGDISIQQLSFAYNKSKGEVLSDINLEVRAGETVALVGRSGSGKTTLVNLLMRFYDISQGEILLDNTAIADFELRNLRSHIAYVSQHVTLFNDTIANNIAYGQASLNNLPAIEEAARAAHAQEFIENLPDGINTIVGENGVLLSGGQRQRIAIARAIFKDAPILILDEATSALDSQSENYIQEALAMLMQNRTTIVIAHRLSTIENADKIVVLEHGRIEEAGSHADLLATSGHYTQLHQAQFSDNSIA